MTYFSIRQNRADSTEHSSPLGKIATSSDSDSLVVETYSTAHGQKNTQTALYAHPTQKNQRRSPPHLHPEHPERRGWWCVLGCNAQAQPEHPSGIGRVYDAVVPQARAGVVGGAFALELL